MNSQFAQARDTFGRQDIGHGMETIITGCREHGFWRRGRDSFGRRAIGPGAAGDITFTKAIGARWWDSMAGLIMDSATLATGMKAGDGSTTIFITTAP